MLGKRHIALGVIGLCQAIAAIRLRCSLPMFSEAPLTTHRTRRSAVDALHLSPGRETFQAQADVQRMRSRPFRHLDETAYRSHRQSSCSDVTANAPARA